MGNGRSPHTTHDNQLVWDIHMSHEVSPPNNCECIQPSIPVQGGFHSWGTLQPLMIAVEVLHLLYAIHPSYPISVPDTVDSIPNKRLSPTEPLHMQQLIPQHVVS